jgi:protein-S-isoprenylcysteine O-methyltransferase Ste14
MKPAVYLLLAFLLLLFAYLVFRRLVRREYRDRGRLGPISSILQLLVFLGYFFFPYLFYLPEWAYFWLIDDPVMRPFQLIGLILISLGFIVAFGTMAWFGIGKAFSLKVEGISRQGPYKISRNPQILGGYLLVIGTAVQRPSLYALGWVLIYTLIAHWMILTEEEHLSRLFGEEYQRYCSQVPRYLFRRPWRT